MNATQALHDLGQSIWLDNITRDLLDSGTLKRYTEEWSVTGLTSNPTIFDHALKALADHGEIDAVMPIDGGDCEEILKRFAQAGIDADALAAQLQDEGAKSFVKSSNELMAVIQSGSAALKAAA